MSTCFPRIIHQIWLGPLEPPIEAMESWKVLHPDWEYKLWNEANTPPLQNQDAFDQSDNYPQKSDILRYELLKRFGGVYVDSDEYCLKSIDPLVKEWELAGESLVAGREGSLDRPELVANTVMAAVASHEFLIKMVDEINVNKPGEAWELTGPQYFTDMIAKHCPSIHLLSPKVFFPIHHRDKKRRNIRLKDLECDPEIYGVHLWTGTKRAYKPKWYRQPLAYIWYVIRKKLNKTFQIVE